MGSVLLIAGTALAAGGQIMSGISASNQYEYNAAVADYEAKYAKQRAEIEERRFLAQADKLLASQRAMSGVSGTVTDSGSNLSVLAGTAGEAAVDAALIRYQGDIDA